MNKSLISSAVGTYKKLNRIELKMRIIELELIRAINRMTDEEFEEYIKQTTTD